MYTVFYFGSDYTAPACLQSLATNLYLWVAILAILGCAKAYCNRETKLTRYMTGASFGLYILHYPVLIVTCYWLHYHLALPAACNYLIALLVEGAVTLALYEGIKRLPLVRYLVLGIKKPN